MKRKDKKMPLEVHIENANDLAIAQHHLSKVFFRCQEHYPKTSSLMKKLWKVLPSNMASIFTSIFSELDDEYHKIISDEQFDQYGHIYYNLDERYKTINSVVD